MPNVVYSTKRPHPQPAPTRQPRSGALVYLRTAEGNDALAWVDKNGQQRHRIAVRHPASAAECEPDTPALPRHEAHHEMVAKGGASSIVTERSSVGGQLGRPSGARFRTYERLKAYAEEVKARSSTRRSCSRPSRTSTRTRCSRPATTPSTANSKRHQR